MSGGSRWAGWLAGLLLASGAQAQVLTVEQDWQEGEVPAPPAFVLAHLVPFDVSVHSDMRFGIEPTSVTVGADGVIRYVTVARSPSGALNVAYEGLRCRSAEFKTYARWSPSDDAVPQQIKDSSGGAWRTMPRPEWRPLSGAAARPAIALARQGFCDGPTPNGTPAQMLRAVRSGNTFRGG